MAKLILVVAIIVAVIGVWELDEIMMLHVIRKHGGDIEWNIPGTDPVGFGVTLPDSSRFIVHWKKGTREYLMRVEDVDNQAGICVEDIKRHAYVTNFLRKCGIVKV